MLIKKSPIALFIAFLLIAQLACNAQTNSETPDPFATLNGLYTASAQTMAADSTQSGFTVTPGLPLPTATPTTTAAASVSATNTPISTAPVPVSKCDAAQFLGDVTYPDGSLISRSNSFVKIWRIKNIGTCTWTTSYAVVFTGGDQLGGPSSVALAGRVNPGEYIEIPVTFVSPNKDGSYRGYWKLRNAAGALFGLGADADTAFWVDIKVNGPGYIAYDFVANFCGAGWENGSGALPCPGAEGDLNGTVFKLNKPVFENGVKQNDPGLFMLPEDKRNGIISGQYPALAVQDGDHLLTTIGCQDGSSKCDVMFRIDYKINGDVKTLGSWHEVYEGKVFPIDINLSSLAGKNVKFIFVVSANGGNNMDNAIWLFPRIVRQGAPPPTVTPGNTSTPTPTTTSTATLTPTVTFTPTVTATNTPTSTATP